MKAVTRQDNKGNKLGEGGYIAFFKGRNAYLVMSSRESNVRWVGENESVYRSIVKADATQEGVGKPMDFLKTTDFIQIGFNKIKKGMTITEGKAICTFNGSVQISFDIPEQTLLNDHVTITGVSNTIINALQKKKDCFKYPRRKDTGILLSNIPKNTFIHQSCN